MATRLGDYVIYGELRNKNHYSTFGVLALRTEDPEEPVVLRFELTGDCDADLKGRTIRFEPPNPEKAPVFRRDDGLRLQDFQIGPTGTMTADSWVRTYECSDEEFLIRSKLNEQPPTVWKRRLYLEWYSQNGRVVIEMVDPKVDECIRDGEGDDEGDWQPLPPTTSPPEAGNPFGPPGLGITVVDSDGSVWRPEPEDEDNGEASDLQRHLDAEAEAIDRKIRAGDTSAEDEEDPDRFIYETQLMDDCIENREKKPFAAHLPGIKDLKPADEMDDAEVEGALKALLIQLAMLNIALNVCEHYSPREAYRLLAEELLRDEGFFEEMIGSGWTNHFCTSDHCAKCDAEFEEKYREMEPEG